MKIVVLPLSSSPELQWYYSTSVKECFRFLVSKMSHLSGAKSICAVDGRYEVMWKAWKILPTQSKKDVLSLHIKISQENIFLNSHCYIDTKPVVLELIVFSVMVFMCLSRQKHNFVYDKNAYMRKLFLFFGLILQNKDKSSFLLFSYQIIKYFCLFCSHFLAFEDHELF